MDESQTFDLSMIPAGEWETWDLNEIKKMDGAKLVLARNFFWTDVTLAISDPDREDEGIDKCGSEWWREARVFQFVREKNENVIAFAYTSPGRLPS